VNQMRQMSRRAAREKCIKVLYQIDLAANSPEESIQSVLECDGVSDDTGEATQFLRELVAGVLENLEVIDAEIAGSSLKWDPARLGRIEMAILRLGVYEILMRPDIPRAATINEAVELAKQYGSEDSARFVNGVLAGVMMKHGEARG
jgi:N utilization substance protein B